MQKDILALPGYRTHEYLLVLQPHEDLWNRIIQVKNDFAEKFEAPSAAWGKPHITLARFSQLQMMEERILNRLRMVAMGMPAFKVELKDFGSYPSHTIYIDVATKVAMQILIKHLKAAQPLLKSKEVKPHFMDNFFVTVGRRLLPWQYEKAWLEYSHRHFTGRFIAKQMLLLRKAEGATIFHPIQSFEFMNMPVVTTQGALF